jgi:hypothetical protein
MSGLVAAIAKNGSPIETKRSPKRYKRGLASAPGAHTAAGTAATEGGQDELGEHRFYKEK